MPLRREKLRWKKFNRDMFKSILTQLAPHENKESLTLSQSQIGVKRKTPQYNTVQ